jgi:transcriptional regulator with XRE-family HTH domain
MPYEEFDPINLGQRIKLFRSLKMGIDYTQTDLANALGVATSTVSLWEQGRRQPDLNALTHMSRLFSESVDTLLGLTPCVGDEGLENIYLTLIRHYNKLNDQGRMLFNEYLTFLSERYTTGRERDEENDTSSQEDKKEYNKLCDSTKEPVDEKVINIYREILPKIVDKNKRSEE